MNYTTTIFGQLISFLSKYRFDAVTGQHEGDRYVKKYSAWNELAVLLYAQATGKDSLRAIETGLSTHETTWHHLGIHSVKRSTLSEAHERRDYRIFEATFYDLLEHCSHLTPKRRFAFKNPLYALDSSMVELCLSLFPWAKYRTKKGALKMHTLFDVRSGMPEFITISDGKRGDITEAKLRNFPIEPESILVFDRGYVDYLWWNKLNKQGVFFVTRTKKNQSIIVAGQHEKIRDKRLLADEKVYIGEWCNRNDYTEPLRRITWRDEETKKVYSFITNNFELSADQIALAYRRRWDIELFFKWIKQNLKIKSFLGTSMNAVMSQIWVAMIYFLLLCYIKFQSRFHGSLLDLTRMVRETLMMRRQIIDLLSLSPKTVGRLKPPNVPQLALW